MCEAPLKIPGRSVVTTRSAAFCCGASATRAAAAAPASACIPRWCLLGAAGGDGRRGFRAQPDGRFGEHFAVADAERADPPLPAGDIADERAELDELGLREVCMQ